MSFWNSLDFTESAVSVSYHLQSLRRPSRPTWSGLVPGRLPTVSRGALGRAPLGPPYRPPAPRASTSSHLFSLLPGGVSPFKGKGGHPLSSLLHLPGAPALVCSTRRWHGSAPVPPPGPLRGTCLRAGRRATPRLASFVALPAGVVVLCCLPLSVWKLVLHVGCPVSRHPRREEPGPCSF